MKDLHMKELTDWFRRLYEGCTCIHKRTDTGFDVCLRDLHMKELTDWFRRLYESYAYERTNTGFNVCMRKLHKEQQTLGSTSVRRIYMYT